MGKLVFVNACVRAESRTKKLADAVIEKWNGTVEEVNLVKENIKPLTEETIEFREKAKEAGDFSDELFKYSKQIIEADAIVIAAPIWDLSIPSILKIYLEQVSVSSLLFDMKEDGSTKSYCKAPKLVFVTTTGGPKSGIKLAVDYIKEYAKMFLGIDRVTVFSAVGLDVIGAPVQNILDESLEQISKFEFVAKKKVENNAPSVIESHNLTKIYGKYKANNDVSLTVKEGSIYGLIGRNGAGKSTFMRMLLGMTNIDEGTISLWGKTGKDMEKIRNKVGFIIENPTFYDYMTAYQNLLYRAKLIGLKDPDTAIKEAMEKVGMSHKLNDKVRGFSLGQKQLLGIANAIMGNPQLLVLDEPTNGLDPIKIVEIREMLLDMNAKGTTILISSHILGEMSKLCSCYGFILEGKLIKEITEAEMEAENIDVEEFFVEMAKGGNNA